VGDLEGKRIQYPDRIFCCKSVKSLSGTYLTYAMQHPRVRRDLEKAAKSTAGHKRISISDLLPLAVPVPPENEQDAIADAVESQLSVIDHLDSELERKLASSVALRQSILSQALSGQLVPQDPSDEPASKLLKRIAAEREERSRLLGAAKQAKPKTKAPRRRATKE
jgi:type I restriction enzyme S subunit